MPDVVIPSPAPPAFPERACAYEAYDPETLVPTNAASYTRLLELGWSAETFAGKEVLDIGANAGLLSLHAHRLGASGVRSVDVQRPLVAFFGDVVRRHGLPIEVAEVSFDALTVDTHEADVVLCMEVLHWLVCQGTSVADGIAKLASLTRETLFLETPWDVSEPSIAGHGEMTAEDYDAEQVLRELNRHFTQVEVVRFMTYFGEMRDSKRVLIRASGRRAGGSVLARLGDAITLDLSLSRGSNPVSLLSSPQGPKVLKTLPRESILSLVDEDTLNGFVEHLRAAPIQTIVPPERVDGRYVVLDEEGRRYMLFPFVGDLGDYFPEPRPHAPVDSPIAVALATTRQLAGMPETVLEGFRRLSQRARVHGVEALNETMLGALRERSLIDGVRGSLERASDYEAEQEDALVHNDLQLGNMLRGTDGVDRVIDIDLVRSGTAYSDLLCAAIHGGADAETLDGAIDELEREGTRPIGQFDIDFSVAIVMLWAREISRQEATLPASQLQSFADGLATVSDCLAARGAALAEPVSRVAGAR